MRIGRRALATPLARALGLCLAAALCVVANAEAVDEWTAGGLHPATDPGSWVDAGCFAMVSVVNGAFERVVEGSQGEMDCEPDVWVELG